VGGEIFGTPDRMVQTSRTPVKPTNVTDTTSGYTSAFSDASIELPDM